jgi:hypothetical protein
VFAVILATCVVVVACSGCWFALIHYSQKVGLEITWFIVTFAVVMICFYALFSGYLSQANFMAALKWAEGMFKQLYPFGKSTESAELSAASNDDITPTTPKKG